MPDREDPRKQQVIVGEWMNDKTITELQRLSGNTSLLAAKCQRDYLKEYYNSPVGKVSCQNALI